MLVAFIREGGGLEEIAAAGGVVREQKVQPILDGMRAPGPDGPNAPRRVMLQRLLAERFGLRAHHENRDAPGSLARIPPPSPGGVASRDDGSSLSTALREQLGLRLQPQTGPVDILVIDAASWPAAN